MVFPRFKHILSRLNSNIFGSWTNSANRTHHPLPTHFSSLTPTCLTIPLVYLFRKLRKTRQIVCSGQVQDARSRSRLRNPRDHAKGPKGSKGSLFELLAKSAPEHSPKPGAQERSRDA